MSSCALLHGFVHVSVQMHIFLATFCKDAQAQLFKNVFQILRQG